ncbi:MAG: NEL-type E3 ubiquitin ligase domain-containing protein [Pseudomonas sp.]|uniref:NEL-type E3 ubiquitin ligase domain-containing protein n=1 Tax=Pseudomonas sp. TaxID=306 RepID=UPI003D13DF0C
MPGPTQLISPQGSAEEGFAPLHQLITDKLSPTLLSSSAAERQALRRKRRQPMPWVEQAVGHSPELLAALHSDYATLRTSSAQVRRWLADLPDPAGFAEPLLRDAIKERFGLELDVRKVRLFNAGRVRIDESFVSLSQDPVVRVAQALKAATQSLLDAALQNFEAHEAEPGGMDKDDHLAEVLSTYGDARNPRDVAVAMAPSAFARLCRELDLGERYQRLIANVFVPPSETRHSTFKALEKSTLLVNLHLACLHSKISKATHDDLQVLASPVPGRVSASSCAFVHLWDVELTGVVLFHLHHLARDGLVPVALYIPDDPVCVMQQFDCARSACLELRKRLREAAYREFFARFIPARHRAQLLTRLYRTFYPKRWNKGGWYEEVLDEQASPNFETVAINTTLTDALLAQKQAVARDDGLYHAVPTAAEDHKTLVDKLRYFSEVTVNVLNIAALVVPGLGEVMLAVAAAQAGYEVFEAVDSLAQGEREQALGYLMDVLENVAIAAAVGVVATGGAVQVPAALEGMRPVRLADGSTRWWKPDLAPFARDTVLPAELKPTDMGLYEYQDRQWLKLKGRTYALDHGADGVFRLEHPSRPFAYQPALRHNGAGAWLHELDRPQEWEGLTLFRRLGPVPAAMSDETAARVLTVGDVRESELRQALIAGERPPALLNDTVQRFRLADQLRADGTLSAATFDSAWRALQAPLSRQGQLLQRMFPGLSNQVVEEILAHVSASERLQLSEAGRVPLRVAEEARAYQHKARLTRACEGLYLDIGTNPDSALLLWRNLAALPGWPSDLCLELREGWAHGVLRGRIGVEDAADLRVVIESAEGYRAAQGQAPGDWYDGVLQCLSAKHLNALGIADKAALQATLRAQPLPSRAQLRELLGMQPLEPGARSPMRLADGRIGYPLSGRAGSPISEATLLDKLHLLELPDAHPEEILQALYGAGLDRATISQRLDLLLLEAGELRTSLTRPSLEGMPAADERSLNRQRIDDALWRHWRNRILPERGQQVEPLRLDTVHLVDFPAFLPSSFCAQVDSLELRNVVSSNIFERAPGGEILESGTWMNLIVDFPGLTTLDIRGGNWPLHSLSSIARRLPRLEELRLTDLHLRIGQLELDHLSLLSGLRRLDLSGNSLNEMEIIGLAGQQLDFLGLDRCGFERWPLWLDSTTLSRMREVSLVGNYLTDLPAEALLNAGNRAQPVRLHLANNRFTWRNFVEMRLSEQQGNGFSYVLDIPENLNGRIERVLLERSRLDTALNEWVGAQPSQGLLTGEQVEARRGAANAMLAFWREDLAIGRSPLLRLEQLALDHFTADLPVTFCLRVRRLDLILPSGSSASLGRFLQRFTHLEELRISGVETPLGELPEALHGLRSLRDLSLVNVGLLVDQGVMDFLAKIRSLTYLQLDGNRLGAITDMTAWHGRSQMSLSLATMGLETWPQWLNELLPQGLEFVGLDGNRLIELPEFLLANRRSEAGASEISLRGNPLPHETLMRAHTSQHFNRPYSFSLDLPEDIALLPVETHTSDSDADFLSSDDEAVADSDSTSGASVWLTGTVAEDERLAALWQQLEQRPEARNLLGLVERLRHSADYRARAARAELTQRVWAVLEAAEQDEALLVLLDGMALEPLKQLRNHGTCPDGIRMEFNQMEVQVFTRQALRQIPEENRGEALYSLARRLFRSQRLDAIAREQAAGRDEAEVRLAYRLRWAEALDLPQPPRHMLYRSSADIRPGELDAALTRVYADEAGQAFIDYASHCDFWVAYLRETHAEAFSPLKQDFERRVTELIDLYPDETAEQQGVRIAELERQLKASELKLLQTLTAQAGQSDG